MTDEHPVALIPRLHRRTQICIGGALQQAGFKLAYLKGTRGQKSPDFLLCHKGHNLAFEVGGKGQGRSQFKAIQTDRKIIFAEGLPPSAHHVPHHLAGMLARTPQKCMRRDLTGISAVIRSPGMTGLPTSMAPAAHANSIRLPGTGLWKSPEPEGLRHRLHSPSKWKTCKIVKEERSVRSS